MDEDSRKRSLPEPLTHAMSISDFTEFEFTTEFILVVRLELNSRLEKLIEGTEDADEYTKEDVEAALILLDYLELGVHNHHIIEGIEIAKEKMGQEAGSFRDTISKTAVVKMVGGT
jgi:hypothetical protein